VAPTIDRSADAGALDRPRGVAAKDLGPEQVPTSMTLVLEIYAAGFVATFASAVLSERGCPAHQCSTLPLLLARAVVWPPWLLFLAAVAISTGTSSDS
jgi:hypothetical protein